MSLPPLLTVEESGKVARISRSAAYAAVAAGVFPSVRIGRTVRIPTHRLLAALGLEDVEVAAPAEPPAEESPAVPDGGVPAVPLRAVARGGGP